MDKTSHSSFSVLLQGNKDVNKQTFLLMFSEYLAERGHNVMYITDSLSCIPPSLHGLTRKPDAFARIHFRYLKDQTQLFETLFNKNLYEKLLKTPHTIVIDGLEKYCLNNDLKDLAKVSAAVLGSTPNITSNVEIPRLVASLTYDCDNVKNVSTLSNCELFYPYIWNIQSDTTTGQVLMKGLRGDTQSVVKFQFQEIDSPFGEQQLIKLKTIMHTFL